MLGCSRRASEMHVATIKTHPTNPRRPYRIWTFLINPRLSHNLWPPEGKRKIVRTVKLSRKYTKICCTEESPDAFRFETLSAQRAEIILAAIVVVYYQEWQQLMSNQRHRWYGINIKQKYLRMTRAIDPNHAHVTR